MAQSAFDATIMGGPPYFDDFDEAKRFLKVLFRPGRPLQSRELSQVQSILQNQIERFGRHVFQEGSVATGGSISDCASKFVRITEDLTAEQKTALVGKKLKNTSNVNAVVIGVEVILLRSQMINLLFFVLNTSPLELSLLANLFQHMV